MEQSSSGARLVVAVGPENALTTRPRLFAALEAGFPVSFVPAHLAPSPAAVINVSDRTREAAPATLDRRRLPTIQFAGGVAGSTPRDDVRLLPSFAVDRRLRDVTLGDQLPGLPIDAVERGAEVLAVDGTGPRWVLATGSSPVHRVSGSLPELASTEHLRTALQRSHALSVVALVQFLRTLSARSGLSEPPLRAAIVFDDPNVRRGRYGYIEYERLVAHADDHNYHAVMAMVPRDASRAHLATVELFRRRADRLSLSFHGNDHIKNELLAATDEAALSLCAEALRRVSRFEERARLMVDRVMTPPHGMCSKNVASALAALGFDALCAIHPRPWSGEPDPGELLAGWEPATFAQGIGVVPRFPLDASRTEIALRAFMDHPVVLYGHHDDLAAGFELLEEAASRVNAMGDVRWMSLGSIALSNVAVRTDETTLSVRPYANRVRVQVPASATAVVVEEPRSSGGAFAGWSLDPTAVLSFGRAAARPNTAELEIRLRPRCETDLGLVPARGRRPWPAMRRAAAEARDRLMPLYSQRPRLG